jgi:ankyrin repeat protein
MSLFSQEAQLAMAIGADDEAAVRQILKAGVNPDIVGGPRDEPLVVLAARRPGVDILRDVVEAGANVNAASDSKETPLMAAVCFGHRANIEYLLEKGAGAALRNDEGQTAAMMAKELLDQNYLNTMANALNGALTQDEKAMLDKWEYLATLLSNAEREDLSPVLKKPISVRRPLTFRR